MNHLRLYTHLLLFFALALLLPLQAHADFRALLVGIDYKNRAATDPIQPLCGGVNDIDDLYQLMTQQLGIPAANIRVLREHEATHATMMREFQRWLIDGSQAGDQRYFHFSGHGVLVGDEQHNQALDPTKQDDSAAQQLAEALVTYDTQIDAEQEQITPLIRDSDLQPLLQQLKQQQLTLFIDSCHSGGVTKSAGNTALKVRRVQLPWLPRVKAKVTPLFATRGIQRLPNAPTVWQPPYRLFAAARHDQEAHEHPLERCHNRDKQHFNGAMTYALLDLLRNNPHAHYSNQAVFQHSTGYLKDTLHLPSELQQPQFFSPKKALDQPFVLLQARAKPTQPATSTTPVIDVWLEQRGKTRFRQGATPTLYYQVKSLATGQRAWLTLIALAADGSVTRLHPTAPSASHINTEVSAGKTYQLPRKTLAKGENVIIGTQIVLNQTGKEQFKVLLSNAPIVWDKTQWGTLKNHFAGQAGRDFLAQYRRIAQQNGVLLEHDLTIDVE